MKLLFTFFLFLVCNLGSAQDILWQKTIGGDKDEIISNLIPTSDGGYLIGCSSYSNASGQKSEDNWDPTGQSQDYWIIKVDSVGNIQWDNTIGGTWKDRLFDCIEIPGGGYLIGGFSLSQTGGDKSDNLCGNADYWILKLDTNGNIVWQNDIGGYMDDILISITYTPDGGCIIGGNSASNISCDKTENNSFIQTRDVWVLKLDSLGNIQWQKNIGIGQWSDETISSIILTTDGGYLLAGTRYTENYGGPGYSNYWFVKLSNTGSKLWEKTIVASLTEQLINALALPDGNIVCIGYSNSGIGYDKTEPSFGGYDYWILKLDPNCNIIWQKTIGGSGNDYLYSIKPTIDGGFITCGNSDSGISGLKTEMSNGGNDVWILKLDSVGNILWQNTVGGSLNENWSRVTPNSEGNKYTCVSNSASGISGDKTDANTGMSDLWLFQISDTLNFEYNQITGKVFVDLNSNNIYDAGDQSLPNVKITESNSGKIVFSGINGNYRVVHSDTGNYQVTPQNLFNNFSFVPSNHIGNFNGFQQIDSLNNFALQPISSFNNQCITLNSTNIVRSGFSAHYQINFENVGSTNRNAEIIFILDSNMVFVSAGISPTSQVGDSIKWTIGNISPFYSGSISLTVTIAPGLPIGTKINPEAIILPIIDDHSPTCNISSSVSFTINSYDPNDIVVDKDSITTIDLANSIFLEYLIRFQNTGVDTAFSVKVLNPINPRELDINSFELIASSHDLNIRYIPWEKNLEFKFDNILLPDSGANEPMSHGFIRYRIKPKSTLVKNDIVSNFAAIYFDFNNPILTNIARTKIVIPTVYSSFQVTVCDGFLSPSGNHFWINSGVFLDTIHVSPDLDSVFTVFLTVNNTFNAITVNTCDDYISPSGNFMWTQTGTYQDTIPNSLSCDSIITINLNIFRNNSIVDLTVCNSYTSPSGSYVWNSSGTYSDTLTNIQGCDSIISIILSVNYQTYSNFAITACNTFLSPSGNYTWTNSGIYSDTITNFLGCDSIITFDLMLLNSTNSVISIHECENYLSPSGNYVWNSSGVYIDTIPNNSGCDSIIMINLDINNSYSSINVSACHSYLSPSGNYVWNSSGVYGDTIPNGAGCDSIITINLDINNSYSSINVSACQSFISPSGNYVWSSSGVYGDTILNNLGCDSIITVNLDINNSYSSINVTACQNYLSPSGNYLWSSSGVYYDTIPNIVGCDSIIHFDLTINTIDLSVVFNPPTIISNTQGAAYQWIYCDSIFVVGEVNQSFTANSNGSFAVIITSANCVDTSACYNILNVNANQIISGHTLSTYPNPALTNITLVTDFPIAGFYSLSLVDISGRRVYHSREMHSNPGGLLKTVDVRNFDSGIYFIELETGQSRYFSKFIKE